MVNGEGLVMDGGCWVVVDGLLSMSMWWLVVCDGLWAMGCR